MNFLDLPDSQLLAMAQEQCRAQFGKRIQLCAIVNIRSGQCNMDCAFCSQNRKATNQPANLLPATAILDRIHALEAQPIARIGLVSVGGSLPNADFERICDVIEQLEPRLRARICCSFGRLSPEKLQHLKMLGIRRYHHNLETGPDFYPRLCSTQTWAQRQQTVQTALSLGLEVCSGAIFGVGESWADRISLATELKKLGVRQIPLNFLHPQSNTPLARSQPLSSAEALRIIAIFRLLLPEATLRVCGGRPITFGPAQTEIFAAGANGLMTGNYLTTCGEALENDLTMLDAQGLVVDQAIARPAH